MDFSLSTSRIRVLPRIAAIVSNFARGCDYSPAPSNGSIAQAHISMLVDKVLMDKEWEIS